MCGGEHGMCPCDAPNNTYKCLRTMNASENSIFCEFDDSVEMVEWYDLNNDPYELYNLATAAATPTPAQATKMAALHARLRAYMHCWGDYCHDPPANIPPPPSPPPPPPSPVPPGMRQYRAGGMCLSAAAVDGDQPVVGLAECAAQGYAPTQVWDDAAIHGQPAIRLVAGGNDGCLNLNMGANACGLPPAQTWFHLFNCPGGAGNRLVWNATLSAIELVPAVCGGGPPRCVAAADRKVELAPCSSAGAQGWTRTNTTLV